MLPTPRPLRRKASLVGALVCTRCGARLALDGAALDLARDELLLTTGFEPEGGSLELSGCCARCRSERPSVAWGVA